ncbi:MAG: hypothetical protein JXP34_20340 [Planctomycetes bacterium]|nr:hypothetical protein [Planctomycetota bacterium]
MLMRLAKVYAIAAGMLLPLAVTAALVAAVQGVDLGIVSRWVGQDGAVAAADAAPPPPPAPAPPPPPEALDLAAAEARAWGGRMASLAREIEAESPSARGKREVAGEAARERERRLGEAMARVASWLLPDLQVPLAASDWPARADEVLAALEKVCARERDRVSTTLASMESRALADLIVGSETTRGGAGGLPESEALAILASLAPKKAGEVLAAIARRSPERAAKLASALVGGMGPDPANVETNVAGEGKASVSGVTKGAG